MISRFTNKEMISIHALREEGDFSSFSFLALIFRFLSTPSARRATISGTPFLWPCPYFYPRPPRGGRPVMAAGCAGIAGISIHALREEGDKGQP